MIESLIGKLNPVISFKIFGIIKYSDIQSFVAQTPWKDECGRPYGDTSKQKVLGRMNDAQFDLAGIAYGMNSDMIELWYAKRDPYREFGHWVVIPGIRRKLFAHEMA